MGRGCVKTKTDLAVNQFCKIHTSKSHRFEPRLGFLARFDQFAKVPSVFTQPRPGAAPCASQDRSFSVACGARTIRATKIAALADILRDRNSHLRIVRKAKFEDSPMIIVCSRAIGRSAIAVSGRRLLRARLDFNGQVSDSGTASSASRWRRIASLPN